MIEFLIVTEQVYQQKQSIIQETIDNQTFILLPKKGKLVELNKTASFIWEKLRKPQTINQIIKSLCHKFEIPSSAAEKDVRATIDKFSKLKLIKGVKAKNKRKTSAKSERKK